MQATRGLRQPQQAPCALVRTPAFTLCCGVGCFPCCLCLLFIYIRMQNLSISSTSSGAMQVARGTCSIPCLQAPPLPAFPLVLAFWRRCLPFVTKLGTLLYAPQARSPLRVTALARRSAEQPSAGPAGSAASSPFLGAPIAALRLFFRQRLQPCRAPEAAAGAGGGNHNGSSGEAAVGPDSGDCCCNCRACVLCSYLPCFLYAFSHLDVHMLSAVAQGCML